MNLSRFSRAVVTLGAAICLGTPVNAQPATDPYSIVNMADGVYGFVWADQSGPEPNMLIVVNDEDVLLVDSSMYPSDARAVVSEIRKLTPKPVRYLVNTHWHDDHLFGNSVIQDAWPDVRIIAHANTRIDATSKAFGSSPKVLEDNTALIEKYRTMLKTPFGIQSYYADWIETLGKLQKIDAQTLFLGHGKAQQDWQHVGTIQNLLTDLVTRVTAEIKKGSTLEEIKKTVTLADWKNKLAGDNADLGRAFDAYFVQPAVERTYHQVKGNPEGFS